MKKKLWKNFVVGICKVTPAAPLGVRAGCVELLNTVQKRVRPKYHVYGHIHEGMKSRDLFSGTIPVPVWLIFSSWCNSLFVQCRMRLLFPVFRVRDILIRIRIPGSGSRIRTSDDGSPRILLFSSVTFKMPSVLLITFWRCINIILHR